jgi:hypothetical protein
VWVLSGEFAPIPERLRRSAETWMDFVKHFRKRFRQDSPCSVFPGLQEETSQNSVKPSGETASAIKTSNGLLGFQQGFLRKVLSQLPVATQRDRSTKQRLGKLLGDLLEWLLFFDLHTANEIAFDSVLALGHAHDSPVSLKRFTDLLSLSGFDRFKSNSTKSTPALPSSQFFHRTWAIRRQDFRVSLWDSDLDDQCSDKGCTQFLQIGRSLRFQATPQVRSPLQRRPYFSGISSEGQEISVQALRSLNGASCKQMDGGSP